MGTSSCSAGDGEVTGVTDSVAALGAGGTFDLSHFAFVGLVDLASFAPLHESSGSLCLCCRDRGLTAKVVPVLLSTRVVGVGSQGASEVEDLLTQTRDVPVHEVNSVNTERYMDTYDDVGMLAAEDGLLAILSVVAGNSRAVLWFWWKEERGTEGQ